MVARAVKKEWYQPSDNEGIPNKISMKDFYFKTVFVAHSDTPLWNKGDIFETVGMRFSNSKSNHVILAEIGNVNRPNFEIKLERLSLFFNVVPERYAHNLR